MSHPFHGIPEGPIKGEAQLLRSFKAFRRAVPEIDLDGTPLLALETWPAWNALREDLGVAFVDPASPLSVVAQAGVSRGIALFDELDVTGDLEVALRSAPFELLQSAPDVFTSARERAARWAQFHGAELVTGETAKTRAAIRSLVVRAISGTVPQREAARLIMAIEGFGLAPHQDRQLQTAVEGWRAEGVSRRNVQRRARRLHKRLLLRRARLIWSQEKRAAVQEGARQGWEELRVRELTSGVRLVWAHDNTARGHPCARCASMIGRTTSVELRSVFTGEPVRGGGTDDGRVLTSRRPPLHVRCDCFLRAVAI